MGNININSGKNTSVRDIVNDKEKDLEKKESKLKKTVVLIITLLTTATALIAGLIELVKLF